jgi:nicotinamide mononucleotide adenylyltransferase
MLGGESWERLVPPDVVRVIEEIKGVDRLCQISGDD